MLFFANAMGGSDDGQQQSHPSHPTSRDLVKIDLRAGLCIEILPTIMSLANCQRHQNAAFIKHEAILVVWADSLQEVISHAQYIEAQIMEIFARGLDPYDVKSPTALADELPEVTHKGESTIPTEDGLTLRDSPRKLLLNQAVISSITLLLIIVALGTGWRRIALEIAVDHRYLRIAVPLQFWLALVCE